MTAGTLTLALRTAQSGLLTAQATLDKVANNIANVNTPGYSRKVVTSETRVLAGVGSGVQIGSVVRKIDEGLLRSLRLSNSDFNKLDIQSDYFDRTQELFRAPADNDSLSHYIANLTEALEALAISPDKTLEQSEVVRWGREVSLKLNDMSTTIQELRRQADSEISDIATLINQKVANIGDLNDKIVRNGAVNLDTTDLRDQRDAAIDKLSELVDIRYFFRGDGDVVVFTSGGRTLVDSLPVTLTHTPASSVTATTTHAEGDISGIYVGTAIALNDITGDIRSGKLKGLIDIRDQVLTNLQSQIDELAAELRDAFNQVHNRGFAFPGQQSTTGTRNFVTPAISTVTFGGTTDTRIVLMDASGDQIANTTVRSSDILNGASGTINAMAAAMQTWIRANSAATTATVAVTDGKLAIKLNSTAVNFAFRDEATVNTLGATQQDATITYDVNADGTSDETVSGFANFFGLNDFFVDGLTDNVHESNLITGTFSASAATLTFTDSTGSLGTQAISAGDSLKTIATNITNNVTNVVASVVPDASGSRLRISHSTGKNLEVTQAAGNTLLAELGLHKGDVRVSSSISVRSDISTTPGRVSRAAAQFDANIGVAGEYFSSAGDDTIVKALAETLTSSNAFDQAGGLANLTIRFDQYAAAIIGLSSSLASENQVERDFNGDLTSNLQFKSDSVRGVNLDEEMSNLILLEQSFSASARVISIVQRMFDALDDALR